MIKITFVQAILLILMLSLSAFGSSIGSKSESIGSDSPQMTGGNIQTQSGFPDSVEIQQTSIGQPSGELIKTQVIGAAGIRTGSTNFKMQATLGQTITGTGSSANFGSSQGYWQDTTSSSGFCDCEPGNVNGDGTINIFDITYVITYLYLAGPAPIPYELCNGDPTGDCTCNIFDVTYLISFLYLGGSSPVLCEDWENICGSPLTGENQTNMINDAHTNMGNN